MQSYVVATVDGRRQRAVGDDEAQALARLQIDPRDVISVRLERVRRMQAGRLDERLFALEMSALLDAGIPVLEALATLRETSPQRALQAVDSALRRGDALSESLRGAGFDALLAALVAAAERSGQLARVLAQYAAWRAWSEALQARLLSAAVYPLMLLAASLAVVLFLLMFVLPRFAGVFDGVAQDIPAASRWLLDAGQWTAGHRTWVFAGVAAAAFGAWALRRWPVARAATARAAWRLPAVGPRLRVAALARLYRCLGLLIDAGVPVLEALRLVDGVAAPPLRGGLRAAARDVEEGRRLSYALEHRGLATPVARRMVAVGENSGAMASMLERAASFHDEEIARLGELVARTVNPLLMLVMGVLIGGIVILMYLPIFTLVESVG